MKIVDAKRVCIWASTGLLFSSAFNLLYASNSFSKAYAFFAEQMKMIGAHFLYVSVETSLLLLILSLVVFLCEKDITLSGAREILFKCTVFYAPALYLTALTLLGYCTFLYQLMIGNFITSAPLESPVVTSFYGLQLSIVLLFACVNFHYFFPSRKRFDKLLHWVLFGGFFLFSTQVIFNHVNKIEFNNETVKRIQKGEALKVGDGS